MRSALLWHLLKMRLYISSGGSFKQLSSSVAPFEPLFRFHDEYSGSAGRLGVGGFGCVHLVHHRSRFDKSKQRTLAFIIEAWHELLQVGKEESCQGCAHSWWPKPGQSQEGGAGWTLKKGWNGIRPGALGVAHCWWQSYTSSCWLLWARGPGTTSLQLLLMFYIRFVEIPNMHRDKVSKIGPPSTCLILKFPGSLGDRVSLWGRAL